MTSRLLRWLAIIGWALAWPGAVVAADDFPTRPIRIIAPWSVGTPPDIVARILGDALGPRLGQPMIVDNRPGATGMLGVGELVRQPADGYTLVTLTMPVTIAPVLYPDQRLDVVQAVAPIGFVGWMYNVLVVHPSSPAVSAGELVAQLKAKPGELSFASGGNGTPAHLAGTLLTHSTGTAANHVPYNQFPQAISDLLAGRVDFMFLTAITAVAQVQAGKLRALAVAAPHRLAALSDVPTMVEAGYPDVVVRDWSGLATKAGVPQPVLRRLGAALTEALQTAAVRERLAQIGIEPEIESVEQFGQLIRDDAARWGELVRIAGVRAN
jgi:tripartite-type tricarboxylate transporter receptor subunit TctC